MIKYVYYSVPDKVGNSVYDKQFITIGRVYEVRHLDSSVYLSGIVKVLCDDGDWRWFNWFDRKYFMLLDDWRGNLISDIID